MTRIAISPPANAAPETNREAAILKESPAEALLPGLLEFRLGGGPGESSWRLRWRAGSLEYEAAHGAAGDADEERTTQLFAPSSGQWREFWRAVEELGVWRWAPDHESATRRGGGNWQLELRHGEREVRSRGRGAWPGAPSPEPSPVFRRFLAELTKLIDGRAIG
jgi:hypothetical protein